jgi:hypothetical protein
LSPLFLLFLLFLLFILFLLFLSFLSFLLLLLSVLFLLFLAFILFLLFVLLLFFHCEPRPAPSPTLFRRSPGGSREETADTVSKAFVSHSPSRQQRAEGTEISRNKYTHTTTEVRQKQVRMVSRATLSGSISDTLALEVTHSTRLCCISSLLSLWPFESPLPPLPFFLLRLSCPP